MPRSEKTTDRKPSPGKKLAASVQRPSARRSARRAVLSEESIIRVAIALLDRDGADKLTLRKIASELDAGVASLYWYASGKDQLLAMVSDELIRRAIAKSEELEQHGLLAPDAFSEVSFAEPHPSTSDVAAEALAQIRRLLLCLFEQMIEHRWLALQLMNNGPDQWYALRFWELIGRQIQRLGLHKREELFATNAVVNYASGIGAEASSHTGHKNLDPAEAEEDMHAQINEWEQLDPVEFPFVHDIVEEFTEHDDIAEYSYGLELLLGGLERQTWK